MFDSTQISVALALIALTIICGTLLYFFAAYFSWEKQARSSVQANKIERRIRGLHDHVANFGAKEIHVQHLGDKGTFIQYYVIRYYDSEHSWQTRHVIRREIPDPMGGRGKRVQYYWDDPVVMYEREISVEISQAKQQLINDLDLEIHELQAAIADAKANRRH